MAYFHERLKHHEDITPKHLITDDEIAFLLKLQKEMNTQDNVGQADPRFWVIKGSTKEYGIDDGYEDGCELADDSDEIVARDIESLFQYLLDNKYNGILELEDAKTIKMIDKKIEIEWEDKTDTPIVAMTKIVPNFPCLDFCRSHRLPNGTFGCLSDSEKVGRQSFNNKTAEFVFISNEELEELEEE